MDNIEKLSTFWASKEPEYEAMRVAKQERRALRVANGLDLPWDELVMKERAEKGNFWFFYNNKFYESMFMTNRDRRLAANIPLGA